MREASKRGEELHLTEAELAFYNALEVNAVYLRGAHFLEDLRNWMGDDAFFAFMRDSLAQMSGKSATKENFLTILHQHTSTDVSDIIAEYFQDSR